MNCNACDPPVQKLRNCSGLGPPAKVLLNDTIYPRCPRAIYLESLDARYFVNVYVECRRNNTYPSAGGLIDQTAFAVDLFDYLDSLFNAHKAKQQKAAQPI